MKIYRIALNELKKLVNEKKHIHEGIEQKLQQEVTNTPISILRKIARDQGITGDIDWSERGQAASEIWDLIFKPLFDFDPDIESAKDMYRSYFGKQF